MGEAHLVRDPFRALRGLWMLLRPIPLATWSFSALLIGVGLAAAEAPLNLFHIVLMYLGALLMQGIATHAYNDLADWRSGTDPMSPRVLSGGSHVLPKGYLSVRALGFLGAATLVMAVAIGLYFAVVVGPAVVAILAVGIFSSVFYTTRPVALAYRPFAGEWLAALPALVVLPVGAQFILMGHVTALALVAGTVHGLLCIGRLMNHHIPDMEADAAANPPKVTTVVWARQRFGERFVPWVGTTYFLLAAALAALGSALLSPALLIPVPFAMACAALEATVTPSDVPQVSRRELWITALIVANAGVLTLAFAIGG